MTANESEWSANLDEVGPNVHSFLFPNNFSKKYIIEYKKNSIFMDLKII